MLGPILIAEQVETLKLKVRNLCPDRFSLTGQVETLKLDYKKQHVLGSFLINKQIETLS